MAKRIKNMEKYDFVKNDEEIINIYKKVSEQEEKSKQRAYHNYTHACNVADLTGRLLTILKCDDEIIEEAKIAAILHDTGCTEGKEGHPQRSYEFAKEYLKRKKIDLKYEEKVLEAIKIHSNGFDTDNVIALAIILSDKLDIKYTRITKEGRNIIGNRQYQYVQDILIDISNDVLQINFICDEKLNLTELEEYYFTDKVFKSIKSFCKIFNLKPRILINNKIWDKFYLRSNENAIIFDLDGTLWSTIESSVKVLAEIKKKHKEIIYDISEDEVRKAMGLPLNEIIQIYYGYLEKAKAEQFMIEAMNKNIENLLKDGGNIYPNTSDILNKLSKNYSLFIVSNCIEGYIESFLKSFNLTSLIQDFECNGKTKLSKGDNIKLIIERNGIKNAVYVGDTISDKEAADKAGIPFIQARYGFGKSIDSKYFINSIEELPNVINKVFLKEKLC